jgi:hypothetical protein
MGHDRTHKHKLGENIALKKKKTREKDKKWKSKKERNKSNVILKDNIIMLKEKLGEYNT